ncbi:MAG: hypothetical protein NZR01_14750 [Bryobacteraceae bacterium]|nr:hypothetical protein [Bryobacteraceae bacterium]
MNLKLLDQHLRALASAPPAPAPVLSCYVNRESPGWRGRFDAQASALRALFPEGESRRWFEEALLRVKSHLRLPAPVGSRGAAVFARGGGSPFFLPLDFRLPLPDLLAAGPLPRLFPLVALRDNFHRFAVLHLTGDAIRILGVEVGAVTRQICDRRIDPRRFLRRGSAEQRAQRRRLIREGILLLEEFLRRGGYRHLILAGSGEEFALLRQALPRRLASRVLDTIPVIDSDALMDVVQAAALSFTDREEEESAALVGLLCEELEEGGRAVAGMQAALEAVESGAAETVLLDARFVPQPVRSCLRCGRTSPDSAGPYLCPHCGEAPCLPADGRDALVRAAVAAGVPVEVVDHSDALLRLGGAACLLRPGRYCRHPAA